MANQEHLDILAKGVEAWNQWRVQNPAVEPDLRETDFTEADFGGADFSNAKMSGSIMDSAYLSQCNFTNADLDFCRLRSAVLNSARLVHATLRHCDLCFATACAADLSGADLTDAILIPTDLSTTSMVGTVLRRARLQYGTLEAADLRGADLTEAQVNLLKFVNVDLSGVIGLDSVHHRGPSPISIDTIYRSGGKIPESFLRGAGVPENFITYMRSLTSSAFDFYTCFISYSTKDQEFAERLYADLQARGVRCWFAPEEVKGGRKLHEQIDEAIRVYDKLLLILSDASMSSPWVKTEIAKARKREQVEKRRMLFSISIVPYDAVRGWECFDADVGKDSAREIREYFVPDFSGWKDHDSYGRAFERLVRDLKATPNQAAVAPNTR